MSKIILIEPYKILQQAIGLALFPDHEVDLKENLREIDTDIVKNCDLLIVDAAALREVNGLAASDLRAVQEAGRPVIWLDDEDSAQWLKEDRPTVIKKPIEKQALTSAVREILDSHKESRSGGGRAALAAKEEPASDKGKEESAAQSPPEVIELLDVVDEQAGQKVRRREF